MESLIKRVYEEGLKYRDLGEVASYIPELAKENKNNVALAYINKKGDLFSIGKTDKTFSMQSISKVIIYILALENLGIERIRKSIGVKPTALPFNSVVDLELAGGKPRNPLVNAGAMAATTLLFEKFGDKTFDVILEKVRLMADNNSIVVSEEIFQSERSSAFTNFALFNLMVARGILPNNLPNEKIADIYFRACSILVNVENLARIGFVISNDGYDSISKSQKFESQYGQRIRTVMAMAGMYDYCGEFAQGVGLPAKSGVGGGIMTASKDGFSIATYCPGLDSYGNSLVGIKMLSMMNRELGLSIY